MKKIFKLFMSEIWIAAARRNMAACPVVALLLALSAASVSAQTTNYVAATGNDTTGDGSLGFPWLTISNAVAKTAEGNTVLVSTGLYEITTTIRIEKDLKVRSLNIGGNEDRENTIIKGNGVYKVLYLNNANVLVSGFTITNGGSLGGSSTQKGAGTEMNGGTLSNCIVSGNTESNGHGGGVYMAGNALVTDCLVQYNTIIGFVRGNGAGIYVLSGSVKNTDVISNTAMSFYGAGISLGSGTVVSNCLIAGNLTSNNNANGAGVHVSGANALIIDSVISNNIAMSVGGGIGVQAAGYAVIRDSTITANKARLDGGGMICLATSPGGGALVSNCVFSYNRGFTPGSDSYGAGIADGYFGGNVCSGSLTVVDSQIISNGCGDGRFGGGVWIYTHGTSTFQNCDIIGNTLSYGSASGAGIYIGTGSACVVVQNCLIAGNRMLGLNSGGGGIYVGTSGGGSGGGPNPLNVRVESCTIVDNAASTNDNAGSIYGGMNVRTAGMQVWNTVVVSNRAGRSYPDMCGDLAYIAPVYYSCSPVLTNAENGNITNTPVFLDYASGNYRLQRESPGVNAGANEAWMAGAMDLDGRLRIDRLSGKVDMGAYEHLFQGALLKFR